MMVAFDFEFDKLNFVNQTLKYRDFKNSNLEIYDMACLIKKQQVPYRTRWTLLNSLVTLAVPNLLTLPAS